MWWIIGSLIVGVLFFIFLRFRKASHQLQLINAGITHLTHSFRMVSQRPDRMFDHAIDPRFWSDPYLLGYAQGSLAIMANIHGQALSSEQKGRVAVRVFQEMAGDGWQDVCAAVDEFHHSKNEAFFVGMQHGSDVVALVAGKAGPALLADPDVQAVLRNAPEHIDFMKKALGAEDPGQYGAAGALLLEMHMKRHGQTAGY